MSRLRSSVYEMTVWMASADELAGSVSWASIDLLVGDIYRSEAADLVRLARFFVDDRDAAEDLVQEAFIRLARSGHRIRERERVPAYLRSIVLNLARDHNRRGLVSLRHRPAGDPTPPSMDDAMAVREDQKIVIEALRHLPIRQRDCLVLRYYVELGVAEIAETLGLSPNSVKTHLSRGLRALELRLAGEVER
jgi:RNA polymerase sigma-70 factor (sigma-E family)